MINPTTILQNWRIKGQSLDISDQGYSGSIIFKVITGDEVYILKGNPQQISKENLETTHMILNTAHRNGVAFIPLPLPTTNGTTVVYADGRAWELVPFLDGTHVQEDPNKKQYLSVIRNVAKFHLSLNDKEINESIRFGKVIKPEKFSEDLLWWDSLDTFIKEDLESFDLLKTFREFIEHSRIFVSKHLLSFDWECAFDTFPKCIIHRDLTKRNTLFSKDELTGIIDFESVRYGTRLDDIARIVIEFSDAEELDISTVIAEYNAINRLIQQEKDNFVTWVILLNFAVNMWALRHYVELHFQINKNHTHIKARIDKSNRIFANL